MSDRAPSVSLFNLIRILRVKDRPKLAASGALITGPSPSVKPCHCSPAGLNEVCWHGNGVQAVDEVVDGPVVSLARLPSIYLVCDALVHGFESEDDLLQRFDQPLVVRQEPNPHRQGTDTHGNRFVLLRSIIDCLVVVNLATEILGRRCELVQATEELGGFLSQLGPRRIDSLSILLCTLSSTRYVQRQADANQRA